MKRILLSSLAVMAMFCLSGCGERVEVPPAHVAKIMTKDGYQANLIGTSKFRLESCWSYCDKLVLLNASDQAIVEPLEIFMPEDKLVLKISIQTTLSVNPKKTEALFNTIAPVSIENSNNALIPWSKIYDTYAKQIIVTKAREYISQYSISEVASSMEKVNNDLKGILSKEISEQTPFSVRHVGITAVTYPKIITDAQENAAERREKIQQEEAQLQISKVSLERELQEARLQRQIDFEKAEGEAAAQRIQREAVDSRVLDLRELENARAWIEKWDGKLPVTTLGENVPMIQLK